MAIDLIARALAVKAEAALGGKLDDSQAGAFGLTLLGAANDDEARAALALGNVDNTSDADKPVSTAQQEALDLKASLTELAEGAGAGLVGFQHPGVGAVVRSILDKLTDWVSVKDFGAVGDGVADDTAAVQAALTAASGVVIPAGLTCLVSGVTLPSGKRLLGPGGLKLKNASNVNVVTLDASGTDQAVEGLTIDGNAANQTSTSHGIYGSDVSRAVVRGNRITGTETDGVHLAAGSKFVVNSNIIETPGLHGITMTTAAVDFTVSNNIVNDPAGAGIIFSAGSRGSIVGNIIEAPGGSGDGITGYDSTNTDVTVVGNMVNGSANHGIHVGGTRIAVNSNTVNNSSANSGIFIGANVGGSSANPMAVSSDCVVTGNVVNSSFLHGIHIRDGDNCVVGDNAVKSSTNHQILMERCIDSSVNGNRAQDGASGGIVLRGTQDSTLYGNTTHDNAGDAYRFESSGATHATGNVIAGCSSIGDNRGFIELANANNNIFRNCSAVSTVSTDYIRAGTGSRFENCHPTSETVASAAALPIKVQTDFISVTGTTTITSLSGAGWAGKTLTLKFNGTITIAGNANNLRLNGGTNFNAVDGNTLSLRNDGTNWREIGRGTAPA